MTIHGYCVAQQKSTYGSIYQKIIIYDFFGCDRKWSTPRPAPSLSFRWSVYALFATAPDPRQNPIAACCVVYRQLRQLWFVNIGIQEDNDFYRQNSSSYSCFYNSCDANPHCTLLLLLPKHAGSMSLSNQYCKTTKKKEACLMSFYSFQYIHLLRKDQSTRVSIVPRCLRMSLEDTADVSLPCSRILARIAPV